MSVSRTCTKCGEAKNEAAFAWKVKGKRRRARCRECMAGYMRERAAKIRSAGVQVASKVCSSCSRKKKTNEFNKGTCSDGLDSLCRICRSSYHAEWRVENRERLSEYQRRWREAGGRDWRRRYYARHKKRLQARARAWRKANPDLVRQSKRAYYERHKLRYNLRGRAYYLRNRSRILKQHKEYRDSNPEKVALSKKREYRKNKYDYIRRARERETRELSDPRKLNRKTGQGSTGIFRTSLLDVRG